jgi:hypothetical protein
MTSLIFPLAYVAFAPRRSTTQGRGCFRKGLVGLATVMGVSVYDQLQFAPLIYFLSTLATLLIHSFSPPTMLTTPTTQANQRFPQITSLFLLREVSKLSLMSDESIGCKTHLFKQYLSSQQYHPPLFLLDRCAPSLATDHPGRPHCRGYIHQPSIKFQNPSLCLEECRFQYNVPFAFKYPSGLETLSYTHPPAHGVSLGPVAQSPPFPSQYSILNFVKSTSPSPWP